MPMVCSKNAMMAYKHLKKHTIKTKEDENEQNFKTQNIKRFGLKYLGSIDLL